MQKYIFFIAIPVIIAIAAVLIVVIGCKQVQKAGNHEKIEKEFIGMLSSGVTVDDVIDYCVRFQLEYHYDDREILTVIFPEKDTFRIVTETRFYRIKTGPSRRIAEWTCEVGLTGP